MPNTYTHGRKTVVKMRVTGGGAYTDFSGYITDSTAPVSREEHDTTTYDATLVDKTFQGGNRDRTMDLNGKWNPTFAGLIQPLVDADSIDVEYGKAGSTTGSPKQTFSGFVTKYEDPSSASDVDGFSLSIRVSGAVAASVY